MFGLSWIWPEEVCAKIGTDLSMPILALHCRGLIWHNT